MQAEGRTLVARERSTSSTLIPSFPSRYVKFAESIPMVPDPVLRDDLNESLTYSEYRDLAHVAEVRCNISIPQAEMWILPS